MQYYNTSAPTPTSKNSINSIITQFGIRDFLLNKNLTPTGIYASMTTSINGSPKIGEPVLDTSVNDNINQTPNGRPIEEFGLNHKNENINRNIFVNTTNPDVILDVEDTELIRKIDFGNAYFSNNQEYPIGSTDEIKENGILGKNENARYRDDITNLNLYIDKDKQIDSSDFIGYQPNYGNRREGYLNEYGSLNLGDSEEKIDTLNTIGSILTGQGIGIGGDGVINNFDVRSSLAGRVLGATGVINDTELGKIGGQQLIFHLGNNAAFNVQQEALGALNISDNVLSLIKNGELAGFRPSYRITIPGSGLGRVLNTAGNILGFTLPKSYIGDEGSIFQSENGGIENIERANNLIRYTGKGQVVSLLKNLQENSPERFRTNSFRNGFIPGIKDNKGENIVSNPELYAYGTEEGNVDFTLNSDDGVGSGFKVPSDISKYGFNTPEEFSESYPFEGRAINEPKFSWVTDNDGVPNTYNDLTNDTEVTDTRRDLYASEIKTNKGKSILEKTQSLFNKGLIRTIISSKGDISDATSKQTQTTRTNGGGISKGNAVLSKSVYDENTGRVKSEFDTNKLPHEVYCRSWTTYDRYDSVKNMVRNHGLFDSTKVPYRLNTENSVLEDTGFVKIVPYITDKVGDPKNFMFSIENLAWSDNLSDLPEVEKGQGDPATGKRGRIMWFPPYDINFSETSSVKLDTHEFIGRGEPVYTYNNTERHGNLSFKVIVDHPTYINAFKGEGGPDDHFVNSFWAGCVDPNSSWSNKLTTQELSEVHKEMLSNAEKRIIPSEVEIDPLYMYFPNDNYEVFVPYEMGFNVDYNDNPDGKGMGVGSYGAGVTQQGMNGKTENWYDGFNYGLNYGLGINGTISPNAHISTEINGNVVYGINDPNIGTYLNDYLFEKCPFCKVKITGYASGQGYTEYNKILAKRRAETTKEFIFSLFGHEERELLEKRIIINEGVVEPPSAGCRQPSDAEPNPPTDTIGCKKDRKAIIEFEFDVNLVTENEEPKKNIDKSYKKINTRIYNKYYNESLYFEKLTNEDKFVFDSFRQKIRYFHPAFHSMTPEGLNSRLTFLQQCTRQGPTLEKQGAKNLAFGRPPVCILRIGDFYHTKIMIDSLNIDYEPLVWDLNPEGVGVQPMIANVNLTFKFIGGSSLYGPIAKLQNALSFNYYANTHVYDTRSDYYIRTEDPNSNGKYELKDGVLAIPDPEVTVTIKEVIDEQNNIEENQVENNEISNQGIEQEVDTTPTPTIIENIVFRHVTGDEYQIEIVVGTKNVIISDNEVLNNMIKKGFKIKLYDGTTNESFVHEEVINTLDDWNKGIKVIFGGVFSDSYQIGDIKKEDGYYIKLINKKTNKPVDVNSLSLDLIYNRRRIDTQKIKNN